MNSNAPIVKHLVLVGGGHSHLSVLRAFGMKPMPGLTISLISRDIVTPYSGSMPGYLAGLYSHADMHIDLRPLAQFAGARLIQQEVSHVDLPNKLLRLEGRPDIPFDLLSLNIGSRPNSGLIPGAEEYALAVKPIDIFLKGWEDMLAQAQQALNSKQTFTLAIVGGGPASVEIAFTTHSRICKEMQRDLEQAGDFKIQLFTADNRLMTQHNSRVSHFAKEELQRRNIEVIIEKPVERFKPKLVLCTDGDEYPADAIIYATGASIPQWPFDCGLNASEDGFIEIAPTLQSTSHDFVFATGDAATVIAEPRPKSGVYAVRQGKVLADNLRRFATGKRLKHYFPQRQALALMSMGNGKAIASRGNLFLQGRGMWTLKHQIDSRFVQKFSRVPEMKTQFALESGLVDRETEQRLRQHAMRCAGCGAKVAADVLSEVIDELPAAKSKDILQSSTGIEDASRIRLGDDRILIQSVDHLKAPINDPWIFGQIATNHCLSDIYAMGVMPHSALAIVGLPQAERRYARQQMRELMLACTEVLERDSCSLVGGHSAETESLQFGLCVNGFGDEAALLGKDNAVADQAIIVTKPLGTGTLLAADMRSKARHEWMQGAMESMLQSNRLAVEIMLAHGAGACTDITGFGLAGHLLELLEASQLGAVIELDNIPVLEGALECLEQEIFSSLHQDNSLVQSAIDFTRHETTDNRLQLLFDPQTAGGMLFTLAEDRASDCLQSLHDAGYSEAVLVGKTNNTTAGNSGFELR